MLRTKLCRDLGIEVPILSAPLGGGGAGPELASAVSNAGGLGLIGMGFVPAPFIREAIRDRSDGRRRRSMKRLTLALAVALTVAAMALAARSQLISPAKDQSGEQQSKDKAVVEAGVATGAGASCHPGDPEAAGSITMSEAPTTTEAPIPVAPSVDVEESVNTQGEHVKTVLFKSFLIDRIYPSMKGPSREQTLRLLPLGQSRHAWITGYRAEVLDGRTGEASQEFMCHTNLRLRFTGAPGAPPQDRAELSISQGQKEVNFPKGLALRIENDAQRQVNVMATILNNNYPQIFRQLDFKSTIRYVDDRAAAAAQLSPLVQTSVFTACLTEAKEANPGEFVCEPASPPQLSRWLDGRQRTGHWLVPPGRQATTQDVTKILNLNHDTTVHYIWMHVHPYAESLELRDATLGKLVWKGSAKNPDDPSVAQILSTDSYSDPDGIPLYKDHQYLFTTVYNNRTQHPVDAMAALWMYVKDKAP